MKALIFGSNGQDGFYLAQFLKEKGIEVTGISRATASQIGDIGDTSFTNSLIKHHHPDYIFHFAANSTTQHSALFDNHNSICSGTLNILEAARLHVPMCKIFLSGSAMQFENIGLPINENTRFEASSPYSISRIQSVYAGRYYRSTFNLPVYVGYFFNHDSPLRSDRHVNQKVISFIRSIYCDSTEVLKLGNMDVKKEFNYAGDMIEAVWLLVNQDQISEAVIGSGCAYSIKEWVEYCFYKAGKDWRDYIEVDDHFIPEYKTLVSDPRIIKGLGWRPRVSIYELADMMMEPI